MDGLGRPGRYLDVSDDVIYRILFSPFPIQSHFPAAYMPLSNTGGRFFVTSFAFNVDSFKLGVSNLYGRGLNPYQ